MESLGKCTRYTLRQLLFSARLLDLQSSYGQKRLIHAPDNTISVPKFLKELLGCTEYKAKKILDSQRTLRKLDVARLQKTVNELQNLGISQEDIAENPAILTVLPQVIRNRGMILQEGGFSKINSTIIKGYIQVVKKHISLLKSYELIPEDVNVVENFLSHIEDLPPSALKLDLVKITWNDEATFYEARVEILKHFLCWKLHITQEDSDKLLKTYNSRIRHKSFRIMQQTLKILQNDLGFTVEKIQKHGYLLSTYPDNTENTLRHFKTIAGMDVKELLNKYPKIIASPTETLIKSLEHLKNFGIPDEAIQKCPYILTLGSENVYQRLLQLESTPEFSGFLKNPRVIQLVHYQRRAQSRLSILQDMKLNCVSLYLLSAGQARFERYILEGSDRTKGNDTVEYLSAELSFDKMRIRSALHRHPFWCHVPLSTVTDTLSFLMTRGYTNNDIIANIQVVLYNRNVLQKELTALFFNSELQSELLDLPVTSRLTKLSKKMQLALCLYFIERRYHFSGDGVWAQLSTQPTQIAAMEKEAS